MEPARSAPSTQTTLTRWAGLIGTGLIGLVVGCDSEALDEPVANVIPGWEECCEDPQQDAVLARLFEYRPPPAWFFNAVRYRLPEGCEISTTSEGDESSPIDYWTREVSTVVCPGDEIAGALTFEVEEDMNTSGNSHRQSAHLEGVQFAVLVGDSAGATGRIRAWTPHSRSADSEQARSGIPAGTPRPLCRARSSGGPTTPRDCWSSDP